MRRARGVGGGFGWRRWAQVHAITTDNSMIALQETHASEETLRCMLWCLPTSHWLCVSGAGGAAGVVAVLHDRSNGSPGCVQSLRASRLAAKVAAGSAGNGCHLCRASRCRRNRGRARPVGSYLQQCAVAVLLRTHRRTEKAERTLPYGTGGLRSLRAAARAA